jgi:EAL domain-containing protein (putative c-di-GMP-specific phosphodiesterase class I)/FixJ family two-component response regulator
MKKTLLLVDDEPNILHALERVFEDEDYEILSASSGQEGLSLLEAHPAQIIISDQRMPIMTGSEFLTKVKELYPETIRIILSGYSDFQAIKDAINEGSIYKFFNKPWDDDLLRREIRDAFSINAGQKDKEMQLIRLMNRAKLAGLHIEPNMSGLINEDELKTALEKDEFVLYYQPIVNTESSKIVAAEVLLRWQHPARGLLGSDTFITSAEENGFIIPLTLWVIKKACQKLKEWQTIGYTKFSLAINLSVSLLQAVDLIGLITDILKETNILPNTLDLEITESLIMQNVQSNSIILDMLRQLGIKLSIDDFGTGYSSLSYLKDFPMNILKIDKSFIKNIATDFTSSQIVTAIIHLAKSLNLEVIAEGVETKEQLDILKEKHCDYIQGYYFSEPVSENNFNDLLKKQTL